MRMVLCETDRYEPIYWQQAAMSIQDESSASTPRIHIEPSSPRDEWAHITDPNERRKVQNRIAQRKFREKARQQRRIDERAEENERYAGAAYTPPDPSELDAFVISGPPWGSISLKHIIQTGQERQRHDGNQFAATSTLQAGGSTSLGLHLVDRYARGVPAWTSWRIPRGTVETSGSIDTDMSMTSDR